jgi:hypothetical protein
LGLATGIVVVAARAVRAAATDQDTKAEGVTFKESGCLHTYWTARGRRVAAARAAVCDEQLAGHAEILSQVLERLYGSIIMIEDKG